jgi:hypothetical protein
MRSAGILFLMAIVIAGAVHLCDRRLGVGLPGARLERLPGARLEQRLALLEERLESIPALQASLQAVEVRLTAVELSSSESAEALASLPSQGGTRDESRGEQSSFPRITEAERADYEASVAENQARMADLGEWYRGEAENLREDFADDPESPELKEELELLRHEFNERARQPFTERASVREHDQPFTERASVREHGQPSATGFRYDDR